jgi:hypothetical protein
MTTSRSHYFPNAPTTNYIGQDNPSRVIEARRRVIVEAATPDWIPATLLKREIEERIAPW